VVLGLESTKDVGIEEMVYHTKAVGRAVKRAFVVGDMPFNSYQINGADAVGDAKKLIDAGCDCVKVEWFDQCLEVVAQLRAADIAVMGHIGLTPQTVDQLGGFKVQGKTAEAAKKLYDQALALEGAGCFSIVLECVPDRVAKVITEKLNIPTIGIGAGPDCSGQVLVLHDAIGLFHGQSPKFVKRFCSVGEVVKYGIQQYLRGVSQKQFPSHEHSFVIDDQEFDAFVKKLT
jgi:3-methyl-2-oxobutanoate hydroxymethyltransferase